MTVNLSPIGRETPFQTRSIRQADFPEIAKIARCWQTVAEEKRSGAKLDTDKTQFDNCADITQMIARDIQNEKFTLVHNTYACEDSQGHIQGLMTLSEKVHEIYICYLVTNPIHIRSSVNEKETGRMRGIGTYLLKIAEEVALEKGKKRILLSPFLSTIPFYEKNGFAFCNFMYMSKKVEQTSQKAATVFERLAA
jgi:histone acetyltransferase (RNA polymerase elongator complex component)